MKRRSFLSLVAGAPLAAIIPAAKAAEPAAITAKHIAGATITNSQLAVGSITTEKIAANAICPGYLDISNVSIRNARIGDLKVSASNIYAPSITAERKTL